MAGRPRKDPLGDGLVPLNFSVTKSLDGMFRKQAQAHGLTLVDYLAALVALESGNSDLGPALQEGFNLRETA